MAKDEIKEENTAPSNFIEDFIDEDLKEGVYNRVQTRFPPEPNGYLHIGHAKAICINFGVKEKYNGVCNLRMDDTNPTKEDTEYVDAIKEDIEKRGYSVFTVLNYATDSKSKIERAKLSPANSDCHSDEEFLARIQEEDNIRYNTHHAKSDTTWGDKTAYDLCLNTETLGRDYASEVLANILNGR